MSTYFKIVIIALNTGVLKFDTRITENYQKSNFII